MSTSKTTNSPKSFSFYSVISAHDCDIRSVVCIPNTDYVITASRDKTCHIYNVKFSKLVAILVGHENFVQKVYIDNKNIYTGSTDKFLRKFEYLPSLNNTLDGGDASISSTSSLDQKDDIIKISPISESNDHTDAVVAIDSTDRFLATGSWDKTIKIWKKNVPELKSALTINSHEAGVWDVKFIKNDFILSASADKSIKMFNLKQKGAQVMQYLGHSDCVRSLTIFNQLSSTNFYSTGNDGTIKSWDLESGDLLKSVNAHASFCYSIESDENSGNTFSCGEDASLLIFNPLNSNVNNLELPCISAWDCCFNQYNGMASVGTNAGDLFTFCCDETDKDAKIKYEKLMTDFKNEKIKKKEESKRDQSNPGLSDSELAKIPGPNVLETPGKSEDFIQMVRPNPNTKQVDVYKYNKSTGWTLIGQAMSSAGTGGHQKKEYKGKYYDTIFNVEIDARPGHPPCKLPYNYDENPWGAAQRFLDENNLNIEELEVTARFIMDNTPDEFKMAWEKKEKDKTENVQSTTKNSLLPETIKIFYQNKPPMDKLLKKLEDLELKNLDSIEKIENLSKLFQDREFIGNVSGNKIFPLLDLFRVAILDEPFEEKFGDILISLIEKFGSSNPTNTILLTKICCNIIKNIPDSTSVDSLQTKLMTFINYNLANSLHTQILSTSSTFCLNYTVGLAQVANFSKIDFDFVGNCMAVLQKCQSNLEIDKNLQISYRILMTIGTLLKLVEKDAENFELLKSIILSDENFVKYLKAPVKRESVVFERIEKVCGEILKCL